MKPISIYEFDALVPTGGGAVSVDGVHAVPPTVFAWLEAEALRIADLGEGSWIRLSAYSTRWRTRFHADGGQRSTVIADSVPR